MSRIVIADDGLAFDGAMAATTPLGGAESAVVALAEALAARGHAVSVHNRCAAPLHHKGVTWTPLAGAAAPACDLYIDNRSDRLLTWAPRARTRLFWIHNQARFVAKPRYALRLARVRPRVVFVSQWQATTWPRWVPRGGQTVIPLGLAPEVLAAEPVPETPPPPRAVIVTHPRRNLETMLTLWCQAIQPKVPGATLTVYSGAATYQLTGAAARAQEALQARADTWARHGITLADPLPRRELVAALRRHRVLLYLAPEPETFSLAVAEAQALGLPAVVRPLGALAERVAPGESGLHVTDEDSFAEGARQVLTDDSLWRHLRAGALARRSLTGDWDDVASRFESLMHRA